MTALLLLLLATRSRRRESTFGDEPSSVVVREGEFVRSKSTFEGLDGLVAERGEALLSTATLLAGGRAAGEDLLQAALERVMRRWSAVRGEPEIYLRRTLYHLAIDQWRARRRRPEVFGRTVTQMEATSAAATEPDVADALHLRQALMQAVAHLPPRQRAVLVLRYWEELTEAEAAEVLGCSIGTVKSSASRGLARLRSVTEQWAGEESPVGNPVGNGVTS